MIEDWIDRKTNLIKCPDCGSFDVARVVIPWSGETLICSCCKKEELVVPEGSVKKTRRGFKLR